MHSFVKSILFLWGWLLISEILCLILSFSFAIMQAEVFRWMSLFFGVLAHALLIGNAGRTLADQDAAAYRQSKIKRPLRFSAALSVLTAAPQWILYGLLHLFSSSTAALNVYLLFNSPFLMYNKMLLNGAEPFSAVSAGKMVLMALPPLITAASVFVGYQFRYRQRIAEMDAITLRA